MGKKEAEGAASDDAEGAEVLTESEEEAKDTTGATSEILSSTEGTDFGRTTAAAFFFCSAFFFASSKVTSASSFCKSMSGTVLVS